LIQDDHPNLIHSQDMAHIWDRKSYYLLLNQVGEVRIDVASLHQEVLLAYGAKWSKVRTSLFHQYKFTSVNE
jgi:hypothetical protein